MNIEAPDVPPEHVRGSRVIVCATGGIAVYKTATLVSRLVQIGANVTVCMTDSATRFVSAMTFEALSGRPVYSSAWDHIESHDPQHISLAREADICVVAPCTMNFMAKLATGITDDVASLVLSAVDRQGTPVLLAPSMNAVMWAQPSTRRNHEMLERDGFAFVGPGEGWQACRTVGTGRMAEPEEILQSIDALLGAS